MSDQQLQLGEAGKDLTAAHKSAGKQREIGVAEFFAKNRHLLGFDNKRKALMTTIKEAVDNSLDACEEAGILPEIIVEVINMAEDRFRVIVEDNGPGILKSQIPKIFAKLLYGSKFHSMRQQRGQQGIGISAAVMYAQLTTGKPAKITSRISPKHESQYFELMLDTQKNAPKILKEEVKEWKKDHGTKIELDLEATYIGGSQSIDEYLKETAITNPHATIIYTNPKAEQIIFSRVVQIPPPLSKEIKPHPEGVELGVLINMLHDAEERTLQSFLTNQFSRVSSATAKQICENARLLPNQKPQEMSREIVENLMNGIQKTKLIAPPTDCISPIGAEHLEKGLKKEVNAEFYTAVTRSPAVYRGNPFVIEVGVAYGGDQKADGSIRVMRFANRVPLLFQQGACAANAAVISTAWRSYGFSQSQGALPIGPATIVIHIASVWVPFTSESKEAIAHYPEIIKEMKLALQEAGRKLASYVNKKKKIQSEGKKRDYIEMFIPHVAEALKELLGKEADQEKVKEILKELLEKHRGELEDMEFDPSKNTEYDAEFAKIGRDEEPEEGSEEKNEEE